MMQTCMPLFPETIPGLLTVLCSSFILITVTRNGSGKPLFRLLGITCFLFAASNVWSTGIRFTMPDVQASAAQAGFLSLAFFFVPIGVHFSRILAGGKGLDRLTISFYAAAFALAAASAGSMHILPPAGPAFAGLGLATCLWHLKNRKTDDSGPGYWLVLSGIFLLPAMSMPIPIRHFHPVSLGFLPVMLLSLGFSLMRPGDKIPAFRKDTLVSWFIAALIAIPALYDVLVIGALIARMGAGQLAACIISFGVTKVTAVMLCLGLAVLSLAKKEDRTEGLLLFSLGTFLALINLQDILVLLPGAVSPQVFLFNDLFIAASVGMPVHLVYRIFRKSRSAAVPVFYGLSLTLMLLALTNAFFPDAAGGIAGSAAGHYHELFLAAIFSSLVLCIVVLGKTLSIRRDPSEKKIQVFFVSGVVLAAFYEAMHFFAGNGVPAVLIHTIQTIPLTLIFFAFLHDDLMSMGSTARRDLLANWLRTVFLVLYLLFVPVVCWLFREYGADAVASSVIPYGLPPLLSFLCAAFLSLFVLGLEQNRQEAILFAIICFCYAMLNLDIALVAVIPDIGLALKVSRLDHFFLCLIMLGVNLHLAFLVTGKKTGWWLVYLGYAIGPVMTPLSQTSLYYAGMYQYYWGYFARKAVLFDLMSSLWMAGFCYTIYLLHQGLKTADDHRKTGIKRVIVAFLILAGLSLSNVPTIYGYEVYPLGTFAFIGLLYLAYGLFKFNFRTVLQHLRAGLSLIGLTALLTGVGMLPGLVLGSEGPGALVPGIAAAVLFYRPMDRLWNKLVNLFIKNERDALEDEYARFTENLSRIHHLHEINSSLCTWVFHTFSARSCALTVIREGDSTCTGWNTWNPITADSLFGRIDILPGGEHALELDASHPVIRTARSSRSLLHGSALSRMLLQVSGPERSSGLFASLEIAAPVVSLDRTVALLLLGGKNDGSVYRHSEIELLHSVSLILGPHIENALLLQSLEDEVEKRTGDLNASLVEAMVKEREISERNQVILRQNKVMAVLLETTTRVQQIDDLEELFGFTLDQLRILFPDFSGGIVLEDGKRNILEASVFVNLTETEQRVILENRYRILDPQIDTILCDGIAMEEPPSAEVPALWKVYPLQEKAERASGYLVLKGKDLDGPAGEIVTLFIGQISAVIQNKLLVSHLEKMANTDGLTGVYNRTYFDQELDKVVKLSQRFSTMSFSLMIIDVNGLKSVNDTYGHGVGDEIIVKVAGLLKSACRETDTVSRIGGDEFAILMPSTGMHQAGILHSRIRKGEQGLQVLLIRPEGNHIRIPISISIGLAGSDETEPAEVMKRADDLMYADKQKFYAQNRAFPSSRESRN